MPTPMSTAEFLGEVYRRLLAAYGPQHWWPGDTPFEVMVGAVLTQNVNWANVERAIGNLKAAGASTPQALREMELEKLAQLIRPSGFHHEKARKLQALGRFLGQWGDNLKQLFSVETDRLRSALLGVHGIGEETADSILLYAASKPVFVIDAYTRRILFRLGLTKERASYRELQGLFMEHLPRDAARFNEYHALLVHHGKDTCRKQPQCPICPLREMCPFPLLKTSPSGDKLV